MPLHHSNKTINYDIGQCAVSVCNANGPSGLEQQANKLDTY